MTSGHSVALKLAAALWVVWGFVHVFAGVIIISAPDAASAVQAVADAVPKEDLVFEAHPAAAAAWVAALTGGMADVGYFIFMDLGGYVNFMPGGLMTYVSASAILLSAWAWFGASKEDVGVGQP